MSPWTWPGATRSARPTTVVARTDLRRWPGVELCLFDDDGKETRCDLPEREALVWHGYLRIVLPGRRYNCASWP